MCVIPITSLYILLYMLTMMKLDILNSKDGIYGLRPAQAHCSLQNCFTGQQVFILCWTEPRIQSPLTGLANSGRHSHT